MLHFRPAPTTRLMMFALPKNGGFWNEGTPNHRVIRLIRPSRYWNPWWLVPRPSGDGCVLGLAITAEIRGEMLLQRVGCSLGFRSGDAKSMGCCRWPQRYIRDIRVYVYLFHKLRVLLAFAPMCFNLCVCSCLFFYFYPSTYLLFFHACMQPSIRPSCHPPIPISVYLHFSVLIMEKANFSCLSQHLWSWMVLFWSPFRMIIHKISKNPLRCSLKCINMDTSSIVSPVPISAGAFASPSSLALLVHLCRWAWLWDLSRAEIIEVNGRFPSHVWMPEKDIKFLHLIYLFLYMFI